MAQPSQRRHRTGDDGRQPRQPQFHDNVQIQKMRIPWTVDRRSETVTDQQGGSR